MKRLILRIYPFLIACYPVLALRNYNILYVDLASIVRTLLIVIIITALIWTLTKVIVFRDWDRAGVVTSMAMILILSYGHIHIQSERFFGEQVRHSVLILALGGIFILGAWLAIRKRSTAEAVRNFLATVAVILVLMTSLQSLYYEYGAFQLAKALSNEKDQPSPAISGSASRPDIYLIVLDAHGRADVLQEKYGYDSSAFLRELTDMGFYVAECSQSNYASTNLSLTSLLQMDYLPAAQSNAAKLPPLKESAVLRTLDRNGYTVITFETRTGGHFDLQEDIRLAHNQLAFGELNLMSGLNEFETVMLNTSITRFFLDTRLIPGFNADSLTKFEDIEHYQQTQFILSKMQEVPAMKSPKFVLVHILVPHSPFVFTSDGSFRYPEDTSRNGYRDNVAFIDRSILTSIRAILDRSERPPVILLMGDHGPPPGRFATQADRLTILNAFYVSNEMKEKLYDSISPVNSFRLILNQYFDEDYPLLDDVSYSAYKMKQLGDAPVVENTCTSAAR
jgi:hypothetical protein